MLRHNTAMWLTQFCEENDLDFPEYICHSMNPLGRKNIAAVIETYKKYRENGNTPTDIK